jgi:hypothetical protein
MIKTWLSAAKVGIKTLILYIGISALCALCLDGYILLELLWKPFPDIHWLGIPSIGWLFLFLLGIAALCILAVIIGINIAIQKVLQYLLTEYEPYIWEYVLKYIKKHHSGELTVSIIQKYLTTMTNQIHDLPWLIKKAVILFVQLFPVAEMIYKKSNLLVDSNFDEKKVAEELAKEKNELEEIKISNAPWLMLIIGGQSLLFVIYQIVR